MPTPPKTSRSRRDFVATVAGIGAAVAITDWAAVRSALAQAATAATQQPAPAFTALTPEEAADISAAVERIIPSDSTPGAREAGVIHFIDRAFGTFMKDDLADARKDLKDLNRRAAKRDRNARRFSQLSKADQDAVLRDIEQTPMFNGLRYLTIVGMFANPSYGGNRDHVGWKILGFEPHAIHKPPFGYYDAQESKGGRRS
ncbi:MAG: gluconate 2-dehydrogenase subunit 3 family protein [Gemmatimonadaceae bacterium]